jgi:hypothetical protein
VENELITLLLFGGAILLVAVIQLVRRMRRTKTNAYERFLRDQSIDSGRIEDMRTYKLRMATSQKPAPGAIEAAPEDPSVK